MLSKKHIEAFSAIADIDDLRSTLYLGGDTEAYGAVDNHDDNRPAGVIIYRLQGDENDVGIELLWLYVVEEYRHSGVASELLNRMMCVVPPGAHFTVSTVFYQNDNAPLLISLLEKNGYRIYHHTKYELRTTLERLCNTPFIENTEISEGIVQLDDLKVTDMEVLTSHSTMDWTDDLKKIRLKNLEPYISSVYVTKAGTIQGMLLVRWRLGGSIEPVFYRASKNDGKIIRALMASTLTRAKARYDGGTAVFVDVSGREYRTMVDRLYPDLHPIKAWRGEYEGIQ